ncbi:hypothetical protein HUB98_21860 [Paenibacillus barcinonensis]|uniref:Alpha-tubulin suppressor-like RCC1 family protein n=1 Tax=Paenibacillus barcinonensis TaxID=198119 RepID=A0A2V4VM46_PAEBA|nr:hypothetical protein [Paenibacillus barcinonensis]PYE47231.1 alpha-tubulin suppressor-like RCC1 family protein [Paenibacillus barcinonensis]QKS58608.1 hypothetical protein HUB98_21860 [Paenibacillus barcinonensis]
MYSNHPANHVTTEQTSLYSHLKPVSRPTNKFPHHFIKVLLSVGVVSTLLLATLSSVSPTYAANDGQSSNTAQKLHYTEVEGGYYYTVALRSDGSVWAWGRNLLGELGISDTVRYRHTSGPVRIPQLSDITAISTGGGGYSVAVQADGTAWHWGAGRTPSQVSGITNAVDVTAGPSTTLLLLRDGTVQSWANPEQKLPGRSSAEAEPKPALHKIAGLNDVVQTTLAGLDGYALKKDGTVWTWKEASETNSKPSKAKIIKGLSNISFITDQSEDLLTLDSKGRVFRLNEQGKPIAYHHELKVKKIDANSNYVLLVTTAGEVYSYGRTVTGKQGKVASLSNIADVSAGYYHSLARSSNGTVWGWGGDKYEEAGAPATSDGGMVYKPVQAKLGTDIDVKGKLLQSIYAAVETSETIQVPIKDIASALGAQFQVHTAGAGGIVTHYTLKYNDRMITIKPQESRYTVTRINTLDPQKELVVPLREPVGNYSGATTAPYEMLQGLGLNATWDRSAARLTIDEMK